MKSTSSCRSLYEDFNDDFSQNDVILVNTFGQDSVGGTFELQTNSQNLPFTYTMESDETLQFYDSLSRPERILDAPLTEDPDYFWLDPQTAVEDVQCVIITDTVGTDTTLVLTELIEIDSVFTFVQDGDSLYHVFEVPTGVFDTTMVIDPPTTSEQCDTLYIHAADVYNIEQLKVKDPYNTMFVIGFNGSTGMDDREALNFNTTPSWVRIGSAPSGTGTKAIEFVETGQRRAT